MLRPTKIAPNVAIVSKYSFRFLEKKQERCMQMLEQSNALARMRQTERDRQTDRQTDIDTHTDYCNPLAHAC